MQAESYCRPIDRRALFPGKSCFPLSAEDPLAYSDQCDQLNIIFNVIGTPTEVDMISVNNLTAKSYLQGLNPKPPINLFQRYSGADVNAVNLLSQLLCFDPSKRITAAQALNHPYLKQMQDDTSLHVYKHDTNNSSTNDFDWEPFSLTKDQIRQLLVKELLMDYPHMNLDQNKTMQVEATAAGRATN